MFGDDDGKEYIYRFSQKENLMTIQNYLKNVISKSHNLDEETIEVLGNEQVDRSKLEEKIAYLQIANITPYFEGENDSSSFAGHFKYKFVFFELFSSFKTNYNLERFLFESAFGRGEQQSKKKTIFETASAFPSITSRLPVAKTEEVCF